MPQEKPLQSPGRVYNCRRFPALPRTFSVYAQDNAVCGRTGKTAAVRAKSYEELARPLLEVSSWSGRAAFEPQNIFRVQCGERVLRNDQLRRADCDFFGGCT